MPQFNFQRKIAIFGGSFMDQMRFLFIDYTAKLSLGKQSSMNFFGVNFRLSGTHDKIYVVFDNLVLLANAWSTSSWTSSLCKKRSRPKVIFSDFKVTTLNQSSNSAMLEYWDSIQTRQLPHKGSVYMLYVLPEVCQLTIVKLSPKTVLTQQQSGIMVWFHTNHVFHCPWSPLLIIDFMNIVLPVTTVSLS